MVGSYDYRFVVLSVLISILAAYVAFKLAERVSAARAGARLSWLIGGATPSGIGTWSMHYTGMLAFSLPVPVQYHWPTVLLSLLPAIFASSGAMFVLCRPTVRLIPVLAGSALMGCGISGVHYTAMAAMREAAMCHFSPALVTLSVALATLFCLVALRLKFVVRDAGTRRGFWTAASILLMGASNPVMHYTGMAAATFTRSAPAPDLSHAVPISPIAIGAVIVVPLMVLGVALVTSLVDRLQKENMLLDELFEQAAQVAVLTDADSRVLRVNSEFTRVFGYTPQETVGRRLDDLIAPSELRDEFQKHTEMVIAHGQRVDSEGVRQRKDGSRLHVSIVRVPLSVPGRQITVYAILFDITERKRAEEALRESEEQFRRFIENVPLGVYRTTPDGRVLMANPALLRMLGYDSWRELASRNLEGEGFEAGYPRSAFRERIEREGEIGGLEAAWKRRDGSVVFVRESARAFRADDGRVLYYDGIVEDVTERRRAEEALESSRDQLRALAARLQTVREEERARVAREIHDELGQALTSIKIDLISLLRALPADKQPQAQRGEAISKLLDATIQSIRRIVTELRPAILDDLGLVAAIEWAAEEFQARTGIECHVSVPQAGIEMASERATGLFRIFQETLTNVARHANATQVGVRLAYEKSDLTLKVHDNGKGVSEGQLSAGSSLGILGMRERAALLGGELTISSAKGKGTTVRVRMPQANPPLVEQAE